jgi:hypothetical protein
MTQIDLLLSALHDRSVEIERLTKERDALFVLTDRLTAERDDIQRELRKAETECSMVRVECGVIAKERDEARRDAERWQEDALRLLKERNGCKEDTSDE